MLKTKQFLILLITLTTTNTLVCKWCKTWFAREICGADDQTYQSMCHLRCAGVRFKSEGACPDPCDDTPDPVCGSDGQTYWNKCKALIKKVFVRFKGSCESGGESSGCSGEISGTGCVTGKLRGLRDRLSNRRDTDICGNNNNCGNDNNCGSSNNCGNSNNSSCNQENGCNRHGGGHHGENRHGGVKKRHHVENKANCGCTNVTDYCCGNNGVTYQNQCQLQCSGVAMVYDSPCDGFNNQGHWQQGQGNTNYW